MLEIEMKFALPNRNQVEQLLTSWNAQRQEPIVEVDQYFNAPDRDFRRTNEALRLRRIGARNFATYKGPRLPGPTKTRPELEIPLLDGDEAAHAFTDLLVRLGYRPVAAVRKTRTAFRWSQDGFDLEVCLDEVDQVGSYAEVEILASPERCAKAQEVIQTVAKALGLANPEPRSYLRLLVGNR